VLKRPRSYEVAGGYNSTLLQSHEFNVVLGARQIQILPFGTFWNLIFPSMVG
jgi:hypothetical protein